MNPRQPIPPSLKRLLFFGGVFLLMVFFGLQFLLFGGLSVLKYTLFRNNPELREDLEKQLKTDIFFDAWWKRGIMLTIPLAGLYWLFTTQHRKNKQASVHTANVGDKNFPIAERDLAKMPEMVEKAIVGEQISAIAQNLEQGAETAANVFSRISHAQRRSDPSPLREDQPPRIALPAGQTPTFHQLLENGEIAPGNPLILGYDQQGQPQYRSLDALKTVAIAGWQGSGKTFSTAYMIASSVVAYGVQVYVIDPHKNHKESLTQLIQPLEATKFVSIINPYHTPKLVKRLAKQLDRRLDGKESSEQGILLVIEELARLAKIPDIFDVLITFLERCTEETRKANMTFLGSSTKWTARHFKGRADIRGCMNSMLIHKTKPSQADLLLEDPQDKKLVKHLQRPGDAILVTDFGDPHLVRMPQCRRQDMIEIVQNLKSFPVSPVPETPEETEGNRVSQNPNHLTPDQIRSRLEDLKKIDPTKSQNWLADQIGLSRKKMSFLMNGKLSMTDEIDTTIRRVLNLPVSHTTSESPETLQETAESTLEIV